MVALAAAAPATASAATGDRPVRALGDDRPLGNDRLSDEERLTRLAHPVRRAAVRERPSHGARMMTRLRLDTEDGPPEVYLVLRSRVDEPTGGLWVKVRLPGRPNGRKGWVPRSALGGLFAVQTRLLVDRGTLRATLYRRGRAIWRSRIGVGAAGTPTPRGRFWIRTRLRNLGGDPLYGPWAFGTAAYSRLSEWPGGGVIGVHGTNQPGLIPGRPSHGCIRLPNANVRRLARLMPVGTPVEIV